MKEKSYIILKLIKKQSFPLILLALIMVLFFANFFNKPIVYASEQIAYVKCDVNLVNGEDIDYVCSDEQAISSRENSVINFSDINVNLRAKSKLEFIYSIDNIDDNDCNYILKLNRNLIENFKIEYFVDNMLMGELTSFNSVLKSMESIEVKVVVYVENTKKDATLNGALELTFESIGGDND